jgi:starch synthase (maltosyl-transferring)
LVRVSAPQGPPGPGADYFRPNFWPNTPDILAGPLRDGNPSAFRIRATLAATMSPNWGLYSGYELVENQWASETNEEYLDSEKYEIKHRDWEAAEPDLSPYLARLNAIRREHPALRELRTLRFHGSTDDEHLLVYSKTDVEGGDAVLVVVNLDPAGAHEGLLHLDLGRLGVPWSGPFTVRDELTGEAYTWDGPQPYVRLDPASGVEAHVFAVETVA